MNDDYHTVKSIFRPMFLCFSFTPMGSFIRTELNTSQSLLLELLFYFSDTLCSGSLKSAEFFFGELCTLHFSDATKTLEMSTML